MNPVTLATTGVSYCSTAPLPPPFAQLEPPRFFFSRSLFFWGFWWYQTLLSGTSQRVVHGRETSVHHELWGAAGSAQCKPLFPVEIRSIQKPLSYTGTSPLTSVANLNFYHAPAA